MGSERKDLWEKEGARNKEAVGYQGGETKGGEGTCKEGEGKEGVEGNGRGKKK